VIYFYLVDINTYSTWLEIDLNALKNSVAEVIKLTGRDVMAVIKANGYGHGMRPIAQACVAGGATWCGVARIEEALLLRRAGISNRFFSILKKEIIHQKPCSTREEARQRIFEYIETFYNTARAQK
jgi:alanine racemase